MVGDVDALDRELLAAWQAEHPRTAIGAMGTRAKERASRDGIHLEYTYGVIDKCILKALLGEDSLILTTAAMVRRVFDRVERFSRENGIAIPVSGLSPSSGTSIAADVTEFLTGHHE